jgi:transposase
MDSHMRTAQVERLEVVETGRRRRWSDAVKLQIVLESFEAPRLVSATARRHGISRSQLSQWRRSFRPERKDVADPQIGFVPAMVVAEPAAPVPANMAASGVIEIELASGVRMRITGAVDAGTLSAAVAALAAGWPR